ncbi:hypothetical protein GOBAR_DD08006 [Gossypium barbadense]|nr:hypothetical protein GOBAR_DD08006 [Gossypium barbadense]
MATSDECCSVQLIDGDGSFNDTGIESFIKEVKLHECGLSYAVVSIMGPQSSGMACYLCDFLLYTFLSQFMIRIKKFGQWEDWIYT